MARKWIRFWIGLFALLSASAGHSHATLQFVTEPFPPFNYEENGEVAGPMVEVLRATCKTARLDCVTKIMPWRRAIAMAENGQVDGVFSILHGPERADKFWLTDPLIRTAYSFFATQQSGWSYHRTDDLQGMTLGVYGPSGTSITLNTLVAGRNDVKVTVELSNFDALKTLSLGGYGPRSAVFINRDVGQSMIKSMGLSNLVPAGDLKQIAYCIGLSKQSPNAKEIEMFNRALRKLMSSGEVQQILNKYGMKVAPQPR